MALPTDPDRRPPLVVRYLLGNVRTRGAAIWLVVATIVFVGVALALQDPILVGIALIGVVAYALSIVWMDRHDGWTAVAIPPDADPLDAASPAPPDVDEPTGSPQAIERLRGTSFDAATPAATPDGKPGAVTAVAGGDAAPSMSRFAARAFATLVVVATVTYLCALLTLEAGGDDPTGGHLVEVSLDALFGIAFGVFAVVVILRRESLPGAQALSVVAAAGLGLVGGLGYFIAGGVSAAGVAVPGTVAAWLIGAGASGAGVWLAATSGGRGLLLAVPAVLVGWLLGLAAWIAHINAI